MERESDKMAKQQLDSADQLREGTRIFRDGQGRLHRELTGAGMTGALGLASAQRPSVRHLLQMMRQVRHLQRAAELEALIALLPENVEAVSPMAADCLRHQTDLTDTEGTGDL